MPIAEETRPILSLGSEGIFVNSLNTMLHQLGYIAFRENWNTFDYVTEHGVKSFQSDWGLPIDGVVDLLTWEALDLAMTGGSPPTSKRWIPITVGLGFVAILLYLSTRQ